MSTNPTTIHKHVSDTWSWEFVVREPHPGLRPLVRSYVGFVEQQASPIRRIESASDDVVLVLNFAAPMRVIDPRTPSTERRLIGSFASGLFDSYVLTEQPEICGGLQVTFSPLGAFMFYGMPMSEFTNETVEVETLGPMSDIVARLEDAATWEARFQLLDELIEDRFRRARPVSPAIIHAVRRLNQPGGPESIRSLAVELGVSQKLLAAQFREQIGLSPKRFSRVLRFQQVVRQLKSGRQPRWIDLAHACGYYDQAHFNHEFLAFTGRSPSEYLQLLDPHGGGVVDH